jgi:Icc-related predicted phosphoesterase
MRHAVPVRILAASDVHYRLGSLDWLCEVGAGYDALILAGDLLDISNPVPIHAQIVVLESYLNRLAELTTVLVVSGNHDLDGPGAHGEQISKWLAKPRTGALFSDGQSVDLDGVRFTLCPWWDGPITRAQVEAQLSTAAVDRPERWVWVYHSPPAGTPLCSDGKRSFPDTDLTGWIEQHSPDLVLCGHIHQSPWVEGGSWYGRIGSTWAFNAGHVRARVPPHIVIDTELDIADWSGSGEVGHLDLRSGSSTETV